MAQNVHLIDWKFDNNFIYSDTFNIKEYESLDHQDQGDLNWIVPNKIAAFAGPRNRRYPHNRELRIVPEDFITYFKTKKIKAIIRLNNKVHFWN